MKKKDVFYLTASILRIFNVLQINSTVQYAAKNQGSFVRYKKREIQNKQMFWLN